MRRIPWFCLIALAANAQSWPQWGQNAGHTGAVPFSAQRPDLDLGHFTYDPLADQIRQDDGGDLLVHYMSPLVDGDEVFTMSRGDSTWISCRSSLSPCGTQRWGQMEWGVTKLHTGRGKLEKQWTVVSSWKPVPDDGSGWEPVFHPALSGSSLYVPGKAGMVLQFDRRNGALLKCLQPFGENDPNRFVSSPLTIDAAGSIYYTVIKLDALAPWSEDVEEAWLVRIDSNGQAKKIGFSELIPNAPVDACTTTFPLDSLPWPPAPGATPPVAPCGSQRPGLNAAPAVAVDGTIYIVSRAHFNPAYSYLIAVNPDLTPKWTASLRDRLADGCDVLLPPSGTLGGCRTGSRLGVDPATNQMPAGLVRDQSTASPVVAPDGSILFGVYTRYNYARGHLFRFSPAGGFLGAYDFGWDVTPAIDEHDGAWSVILKDNFYLLGSYCDVVGQCGVGMEKYNLTSLGPDLRPQWTYENTNDQACERLPDGSISCTAAIGKFEWCVNMVAVDRDGVVYANSEDGNVYAIDRTGTLVGRLFLNLALGAAYTPLAIGSDGLVYTQNDGTLFVTGSRPRNPIGRR